MTWGAGGGGGEIEWGLCDSFSSPGGSYVTFSNCGDGGLHHFSHEPEGGHVILLVTHVTNALTPSFDLSRINGVISLGSCIGEGGIQKINHVHVIVSRH